MKRKFCGDLILLAVTVLLLQVPARTDVGPLDKLILVEAGGTDMILDGRLDELSWRRSEKVFLRENQTGQSSIQRTRVYILRRGRTVWFGFDCADTDVSATLTKRDDNLWREEVVEIFLDPDGRGKEYLEVEVNPLGTFFDAWIHFDTEIDFEKAAQYDLDGIQVAVHVDGTLNDTRPDRGWSCEIVVPLDRLPARMTENARINLTRIDRIGGRHVYDAWSPTYKWFHVPERFGRLMFPKGVIKR